MPNYLVNCNMKPSVCFIFEAIIQSVATDGYQKCSDNTWIVVSNESAYTIKDKLIKACSNSLKSLLIAPLPATNDVCWANMDAANEAWFYEHI